MLSIEQVSSLDSARAFMDKLLEKMKVEMRLVSASYVSTSLWFHFEENNERHCIHLTINLYNINGDQSVDYRVGSSSFGITMSTITSEYAENILWLRANELLNVRIYNNVGKDHREIYT